jgi:hypothetical protein
MSGTCNGSIPVSVMNVSTSPRSAKLREVVLADLGMVGEQDGAPGRGDGRAFHHGRRRVGNGVQHPTVHHGQ